MPRFHFDIIEGDSIHRDVHGEICLDRKAAEAEAIGTAADLVKHGLGKLQQMERCIEVRDETGDSILRVRIAVSLEIQRLK